MDVFVVEKNIGNREDRILKSENRKAYNYKTAPKYEGGEKRFLPSLLFLLGFSPFLPLMKETCAGLFTTEEESVEREAEVDELGPFC